MNLDTRKKDNVLVIKPFETRIDAKVAAEFKEKMINFITDGNKLIVLNLSDVDFIDSSGLGAIVSSLKQLGGEGDIVICEIKESILNLLRLTRLDRVLRIFSTEKEAITELTF